MKFLRRYTSNRTLFRQLIEAAAAKHGRWSLGGNAPIMGIRFHREGANVLLATQMSQKFVNESLSRNNKNI